MAAVEKPNDDQSAATPERDDDVAREPFDAEALRGALAGAARAGDGSPARSLQERAESALSGAAPKTGPAEGAAVYEDLYEHSWSLRRQLAFIVLASAACWAAVLAPLVLIF